MPKTVSGIKNNNSHTSIQDNDGTRIDLSNSPLQYGDNDNNVRDIIRTRVDEFEDKRRGAKIEFNRLLDANGNIIAENKGGKTQVKSKFSDMKKAALLTHNHPREAGGDWRYVF